jgi:hypothetical protein
MRRENISPALPDRLGAGATIPVHDSTVPHKTELRTTTRRRAWVLPVRGGFASSRSNHRSIFCLERRAPSKGLKPWRATSMKMGTTVSPFPYEADTRHALQSASLRRLRFCTAPRGWASFRYHNVIHLPFDSGCADQSRDRCDVLQRPNTRYQGSVRWSGAAEHLAT